MNGLYHPNSLIQKIRGLAIPLVLISLLFAIEQRTAAEVINPDKPSRGVWDFQLEKVLEILQPGDGFFGQPVSLAVGDDGYIYVYDGKNRINYVFDEEGRFLNAFAKRGQGPGEIMGQGKSFPFEDKILIPGRNNVSFFSRDGRFIESKRQLGQIRRPRIFIDKDRFISAPLSTFHLPDGKGAIILKSLNSREERIIQEFAMHLEGSAQRQKMRFDSLIVGLSPIMILGYQNSRVYWGINDTYKINLSDFEGNTLNTFTVARKKRKISKEKKKGFFALFKMAEARLDQILDFFPDAISYFTRIEVHNGLIYVFVPDLDMETLRLKISQIDIFSPSGEYIYKANLQLEERIKHLYSLQDNLIIKDNFLYIACEREDYTIVIHKYRVALPGF